MDYFGDEYTDIGQLGVTQLRTTFPSVADQPLQSASQERVYRKSEITQEDIVEGFNRAIKSKDQEGNTRLLLGYKEGAF